MFIGSGQVLDLDSPRWLELRHAYGNAGDIPALLRALAARPDAEGPNEEPWFTLWSALAHQDDVYSASFAAVPHVVRILADAPALGGSDLLHFPAWVEVCRLKKTAPVPTDLMDSYSAAIGALPALAARSLEGRRDESRLRCACAAIAAAKGQVAMAEAMLELSPAVASDFLQWLTEQ